MIFLAPYKQLKIGLSIDEVAHPPIWKRRDLEEKALKCRARN
jgi:hypothetical protein